jgi:hypothetical protein
MRKSRLLHCVSTKGCICIVGFAGLVGCTSLAANEEMRAHKGEREFDVSGSISPGDRTSWEISGSLGYYPIDIAQFGVGGFLIGENIEEENEEGEVEDMLNTFGGIEVFGNVYLPTAETSVLEPYVGVLAGAVFDNGTDAMFGGRIGSNLYITDNVGAFAEYSYR